MNQYDIMMLVLFWVPQYFFKGLVGIASTCTQTTAMFSVLSMSFLIPRKKKKMEQPERSKTINLLALED